MVETSYAYAWSRYESLIVHPILLRMIMTLLQRMEGKLLTLNIITVGEITLILITVGEITLIMITVGEIVLNIVQSTALKVYNYFMLIQILSYHYDIQKNIYKKVYIHYPKFLNTSYSSYFPKTSCS